MRILPVMAAFGHVVRSTINNASFAWSLSWPWMIVIIPVNIVAQLYGFSIEPGMTGTSARLREVRSSAFLRFLPSPRLP